jgi:hypothetical protein
MPHAYTEDQLVEQPAIGLFAELGWAVAGPPPNAGVAGEPRDAGLLGRETKGEVVLVSRLRAALERLNPALPPEATTAAISGIGPVSPAGEMACFSETPTQMTGHGCGHERRQESGVIPSNCLFSSINTDNAPDIYADI